MCLQRNPAKRPTISGERGLLLHPFLNPCSTSKVCSSFYDRILLQLARLSDRRFPSLINDGKLKTQAPAVPVSVVRCIAKECIGVVQYSTNQADVDDVVATVIRRLSGK